MGQMAVHVPDREQGGPRRCRPRGRLPRAGVAREGERARDREGPPRPVTCSADTVAAAKREWVTLRLRSRLSSSARQWPRLSVAGQHERWPADREDRRREVTRTRSADDQPQHRLRRRRQGRMLARELEGLQGQALGHRRPDGHAHRREMVAEQALGRRRRGRLHQLVHEARGGAAGLGRGRQGQDLQAGPPLRGRHADLRAAQMGAADPRLADRRTVRGQPDDLSRRVYRHRDRPDRHPVRRAGPYRRGGQPDRQGQMYYYNGRHRGGDRRRDSA